MKKYLIFIFLLSIIVFMNSCGINKKVNQLTVEGDVLSADDIQQLSDEYGEYKKNNQEKFQTFNDWYKINYVIKLTTKTVYETEIQNITLVMKGKVFESSTLYNTRMDLDIKMNIDYNHDYDGEVVYGDVFINCKFIEGIAYYIMDINLKCKDNDKLIGKFKTEQKFTGDLDDIFDLTQIDKNLLNITSTRSSFASLLEEMKNSTLEKESLFRKDNIFYYDESNGNILNKMAITVKEDYTVKNIKMYYSKDENNNEIEMSGEIKRCLGKIITKPIDLKNYSKNYNANMPF